MRIGNINDEISIELREILQENTRRYKWHFDFVLLRVGPIEQVLDVSTRHLQLVAVANRRFEDHSNRIGQTS